MEQFTAEMIELARTANSAEELRALAKEHGMEWSAEEAEAYFAKLGQSGELSDEELDGVSGGGCGGLSRNCPMCGSATTRSGSCGCGYDVCRNCGWASLSQFSTYKED